MEEERGKEGFRKGCSAQTACESGWILGSVKLNWGGGKKL